MLSINRSYNKDYKEQLKDCFLDSCMSIDR